MKIRIGQVIRVPSKTNPLACCGNVTIDDLTTTRFKTRADPWRGIFGWAEVSTSAGVRRPAVTLYSNPFVQNRKQSPWVDYIDPEDGYARYFGDAKSVSDSATTRRNALLWDVWPTYQLDREAREKAPPILIFRQVKHCGSFSGHREFCGYGVPLGPLTVVSQPEPGTNQAYTNLLVEVALLGLTAENEEFDWDWIDDRRDPELSHKEANARAPEAWKRWVESGSQAIPSLRRQVHRYRVLKPEDRELDPGSPRGSLLEHLYHFFDDKPPHDFERAAMDFAGRALGSNFVPGWVTQRSGDGGYDFVGRLEFGRPIGPKGIVVIGEAKLFRPGGRVDATQIARLAARIQRGWMGIFVTTGAYQVAAQREVLEDSYPIVLLDGRDLAQHLLEFAAENGLKAGKKAVEKFATSALERFEVIQRRRNPNEVLW